MGVGPGETADKADRGDGFLPSREEAPSLQSWSGSRRSSPGVLGSSRCLLHWRVLFRSQDLRATCAHCCFSVSCIKALSVDGARQVCILTLACTQSCIYFCTYLSVCILKCREFILMSQITTQRRSVHSSLSTLFAISPTMRNLILIIYSMFTYLLKPSIHITCFETW